MQWNKTHEDYRAETTLKATMLPDEPVEDRSGRKWLPELLTVKLYDKGPMDWTVRVRLVKKGGKLSETVTKSVHRHSSYDWHEGTLAAFAVEADKLAATAEQTPEVALAALQKRHDDFVSRIAAGMPECWGDTEEDVLRFVASFFEPRGMTPGHSEDCDCF